MMAKMGRGLIAHLTEDHGLKPWSVMGAADEQHRRLHTAMGTRPGTRQKPDHEHAADEWPTL